MRRVLVTGGTGYLGQALLPLLKGYQVDLLVRDKSKATHLDCHNLFTADELTANTEYDVVVHLAAFISSARDASTSKLLVESNISFPTDLLSKIQIRKNGIFIDTGTFAEKWYGNKYGISYLYAETKKAFKCLASYFCKVNGVNYVRVIPYTIVSEKRQKGKILDLLINSTESDTSIPITEGQQILDFVHRDDVARLYRDIIDSESYEKLDQRSIDCCTGVGRSIRSVANVVETILQKKCNLDWGKVPYREQDIMYAVGDPSDAFELFGWKACLSLESTIRKNIESEMGNGSAQ